MDWGRGAGAGERPGWGEIKRDRWIFSGAAHGLSDAHRCGKALGNGR